MGIRIKTSHGDSLINGLHRRKRIHKPLHIATVLISVHKAMTDLRFHFLRFPGTHRLYMKIERL